MDLQLLKTEGFMLSFLLKVIRESYPAFVKEGNKKKLSLSEFKGGSGKR